MNLLLAFWDGDVVRRVGCVWVDVKQLAGEIVPKVVDQLLEVAATVYHVSSCCVTLGPLQTGLNPVTPGEWFPQRFGLRTDVLLPSYLLENDAFGFGIGQGILKELRFGHPTAGPVCH